MICGLSMVEAYPSYDLSGNLADLVGGIGTESFGRRLVRLLHQICGANHCAAFNLGNNDINPLVVSSMSSPWSASVQVNRYINDGWWKKDPVISRAKECVEKYPTGVIPMQLDHLDISELRKMIYPHISDGVMLCGRMGDATIGLIVLNDYPNPKFVPNSFETLSQYAGTLLSAVAKHSSFISQIPNAANALTNLIEIENCFLATTDLPKRELEVCARILYGMSTIGISIDLGIGEESVKTYRKRTYQRQKIGCERELLHRYLALWSQWQANRPNWIMSMKPANHVH